MLCPPDADLRILSRRIQSVRDPPPRASTAAGVYFDGSERRVHQGRTALRVSSLLLLLILLAAAAPATAHHSPAMFDMAKRVQLAGVVRQFQWSNPHSYIQLLV